MRNLTATGILLIVVGVAWAGAFLLAKHKAAAASAAAVDQSIGTKAMAAYKSGDYATALPLLKKWAQSAEIRDDKQRRNDVLTYIVTAENKLAPPTTAPSVADVAAAGGGGGAANIDPTTNKPRVPHPLIPSGTIATMGIRDLGNFEFDPTADADIPPDIKTLNGATLRLRGFMIPLNQAEDITDFALVPTLANCCFGQPPGVQHTITCKTEKGKAVQYTVDEVVVEGKLTINVQRDQGYTYSIFNMEVKSVRPAE